MRRGFIYNAAVVAITSDRRRPTMAGPNHVCTCEAGIPLFHNFPIGTTFNAIHCSTAVFNRWLYYSNSTYILPVVSKMEITRQIYIYIYICMCTTPILTPPTRGSCTDCIAYTCCGSALYAKLLHPVSSLRTGLSLIETCTLFRKVATMSSTLWSTWSVTHQQHQGSPQ